MGATRQEGVKDMPPVLVAELEVGTMRSLIFWLAVPLLLLGTLWLVAPAYAFTIPFTQIKVLEPDNNIRMSEPALKIDLVRENETIIDSALRGIGFGAKEQNISVYHEGRLLAIIPDGTPFQNIPVHQSCLELQYGTEAWLQCEGRI